MSARHSTRAFLDREVERDRIERILRHASRAPSGANTQPWHVAVVSGTVKNAIESRLAAAYRGGEAPGADYRYYPARWVEPFRSRRFACGMQLYAAAGIDREDRDGRRRQWIENYRAFGAPVAMYFYMGSRMESGSYLDFGMFLQSVMLAAVEEGLATCPQAALAEYPGIVKGALGLDDGAVLLCGMALGYEDADDPINGYRTPRVALDEFATFYTD